MMSGVVLESAAVAHFNMDRPRANVFRRDQTDAGPGANPNSSLFERTDIPGVPPGDRGVRQVGDVVSFEKDTGPQIRGDVD